MIVFNNIGTNNEPSLIYTAPHYILANEVFTFAIPNICQGKIILVERDKIVNCVNIGNELYKEFGYCKSQYNGKPYVSIYAGDLDGLSSFSLYLDGEHYFDYDLGDGFDLLDFDNVVYESPLLKIYLPSEYIGSTASVDGAILMNNKVCIERDDIRSIEVCLPVGCYTFIVLDKEGNQQFASNNIIVKDSISGTIVSYYVGNNFTRQTLPIEFIDSTYEFNQDEKVLSNGSKSFSNRYNLRYLNYRALKLSDFEVENLIAILSNPTLKIYHEDRYIPIQLDGGVNYTSSKFSTTKSLKFRFLETQTIANCMDSCSSDTKLRIRIYGKEKGGEYLSPIFINGL